MDKLKIYLVDDHKLFREGLKLLLSAQKFVHHIYEASNGKEFVENLSFVDCDVVLMDIDMPEMDGVEATKEALRIRPSLKIIVLSMYGDEQYYYKMIDAGAKGFLLKNSGIDKVYLGRPWRPFAKTVFIGCELGGHILPEGWHNWNKKDAEKTSFYAEYGNYGPGAASAGDRVPWAHFLKKGELRDYTVENVLGPLDEWYFKAVFSKENTTDIADNC